MLRINVYIGNLPLCNTVVVQTLPACAAAANAAALLVILFTATHRAQGAPLSSSVPHAAQVPLPYGLVLGNRLELVDEYLGVPYAPPPLRRFEPPVA